MPPPAPPLPPFDAETLREIVEHAADAIFVTGLDLRIVWVNEAAERMLGEARERILGTSVRDWLGEGEEARQPLRAKDLGEGLPTRTERRMRTADGATIAVEVSAKRLPGPFVVGIAREVTERVVAAERIARSEASFRAIIEQSPDAIVVHRHGTVLYANPACAGVLGIPDSAWLVGRSVLDYMHPDDHPAIVERIRDLAAGKVMSVPFTEERIVRPDGSVLQGSVGAISVVFEGVPCAVAIVRDLTEVKRVQGRLALADRMASLGTLAAGVAHEINNPLTYVMLRLDALSRTLERGRALEGAAPEVRALLDQMEGHLASALEGATAVRRIVRDMRAFSAVEEAPEEAAVVRRAVDLAIRMVSHELRGRVAIHVEDDGSDPVAQGGEGRLAQVVLNLVVNAAQAFAEPVPSGARVQVSVGTEAGRAVVRVVDNAAGMSDEVVGRVFEPFFTTKPVGKGTGLGLFVCHGLVGAMGGTIRVAATSPAGTTIEVALPVVAQPTAAPPAASVGAPPLRRARFLVVEDEPSVARALAELLGELGEAVVAPGGEEARARIVAGEPFDAVLCDVRMPRLSGPDLFRWVGEARPELVPRFAFMTGGVLEPKDEALVLAAPGGLFRKPFDAETVLAHVRRLLDA